MIGFWIGLIAGSFGSLLGLGGGVIMVPLLVGWARLRQHEAHGTSLMAVAGTAVVGGLSYALGGSVDFVAAGLLLVTAMITARLGANYTTKLDAEKLKRIFGYFLIFTALLLPFKSQLPHVASGGAGLESWLILLAAGALAGFLSGLLGIGGGSIMVPALVLGGGLTQQLAQGTALTAMVVPSLIGAYTHWRLGHVNRRIAPGLMAGIFVGAFIGGRVALDMPEGILRWIFAVVLLWTGVRYLRTKTRG